MNVRNQEINQKTSGLGPAVTSDHLSAHQNDGSTRESRDALITLARSQFSRNDHGDLLDMGAHDQLYGKHAVDFRPNAQGVDTNHLGDPRNTDELNVRNAHDHVEAKSIEVKNGDSLWKIARQGLGANATDGQVQQQVRDIAKLNGMPDPFRAGKDTHHQSSVIHPGQHLKLPDHTTNGRGGSTGENQHGHKQQDKSDYKPVYKPNYQLNLKPHSTPEKAPWVLPVPHKPDQTPGSEQTPKTEPTPDKPETKPWVEPVHQKPDSSPKTEPTPDKTEPIPNKPEPTPGKPEVKPWVEPVHQKPDSTPKLEPSPRIEPTHPPEKDVAKPDEVAKKFDTPSEKEQLSKEKDKLNHNLDNLSATDKERVQHNMQEFETRAAKDHLPPDEVRKTYEQANRLYESKDNYPIPQASKQVLADQVIAHAAHPHNIDQGKNPTCNAATVESRLFTKNPSEAAKVIADVATTGGYTAKDGTHVKLNAIDFAIDTEGGKNPPDDGGRSYASKLFQETALDLHYQALGQHYVETPVKPGDRDNYQTGHTNEVSDGSGINSRFEGLTMPEIAEIDQKLTGKADSSHILANDSVSPDPTENAGKVDTFHTEQQFKHKLNDLKSHDGFPAVLWVDSTKPPFNNVSADGAGGSGGGHVVTITDYNPKTGKVSFANQWGTASNHLGDDGVSAHQLFEATKAPRSPWGN